MKIKLVTILILIFCFSLTKVSANQPVWVKEFIVKFGQLSCDLSDEYGIPREVILAISALESDWGRSKHVKLLNNYFGIIGKNKLKKSQGIISSYKGYLEPRDSFIDFCKTLSRKKYYQKLKGKMVYSNWIHEIANGSYAKHPQKWSLYVTRLIKTKWFESVVCYP